ncbi:MAG: hypothetical protein ACJAYU_003236 [Bradymonadia bacterium]|jgi:hypothetical protein
MRSSFAILTAVTFGCGSQPAEELTDADAAIEADAAFGADVETDAPSCIAPTIEPGPTYVPDPSWGTKRAIADGRAIFATIPFQSDAVESHYVTAYIDGVEVESQLVWGQLRLMDARNGRALVRYVGESGDALISVSSDANVEDLSENQRLWVPPLSGRRWLYTDPQSMFDGSKAVGVEGPDSQLISYFDPSFQTSIRVPVQDATFVEAEIIPTGFIATVRTVDEPRVFSIRRWSRDEEWELVAGALTRNPRIDNGDSGVFWTQPAGVYQASNGTSERIFEGDCGPVDAAAEFATFACWGD